ncbi:DNA topoisomerase IV subunit A [Fructilactobacillus sanfranciscensis]|uniref:DNA topoisomerase IV subunit A n=2 Tax=Fructilactobacillus sanfranciscensis TaxID=1625 RepID=UPI0023AAC88B|nr:DNA topoisomerase IV subunit A [Fructilactobacillus sanfranciscensis]WED56855.1 DNA topoisomerase IV subunit A [Fructilactobacillus sanfranciscensis]
MAKEAEIKNLSLASVMDERFSRYSKAIIQERALPDVRDGLKPVQRRILYSMNKDGNTYDKGFRKSAKSVGNVMGNFHPHGDSSIYDAMVRMSQSWKLREPLIDMHGNNGSMDGDPPAAMRYTEARISKIAGEMLRDIDKGTVDWVLNFDDTEYEPTVLPARLPNLLINGATGISAGYATEIPPHNLGEVIDALLYLQGHADATLDDLMKFVQGPDFPTGGIIQGIDGIKQAYKDGHGKIMIRSRSTIEDLRGGKKLVKVTEIPYEVNKSQLVKQIDEIRINKKVDGIAEVRDDSDRTGLMISIELKRDAEVKGILNYLYKNTDLQVSYNFNVVAIKDMRPQRLGLKDILATYLDYQRSVITKRTKFDLDKAQERQHIVEGLIKALSILDEVISTIRSSSNRKDARDNLMSEYDFTEKQADAIVALQLYRLTNTDVTKLKKENADLAAKIAEFKSILANPEELDHVLADELRDLEEEYRSPRRSTIEAEIENIKISKKVVVPDEQVMVMVSRDGYLKRSSIRSYKASELTDNGLKDEDCPVFIKQLSTRDSLFIFTDAGNLVYRPVFELDDVKWKDTGDHISQLSGIDSNEKVLASFAFPNLKEQGNFVITTKSGHIKQTEFEKLLPGRTYKSRATVYEKLKDELDSVVDVEYIPNGDASDILIMTEQGLALRYSLSEVSVNGARTTGAKAISLSKDDVVVNAQLVNENSPLALVFQNGNFKKIKTNEIPVTSRARKGVKVLRDLKTRKNLLANFVRINPDDQILTIYTDHLNGHDVILEEHGFSNRTSNGNPEVDVKIDGVPVSINHQPVATESDEITSLV